MAETFTWPGGARLAMSFVINVEEGSEMSLADGDKRPCGSINPTIRPRRLRGRLPAQQPDAARLEMVRLGGVLGALACGGGIRHDLGVERQQGVAKALFDVALDALLQ